MIMRLITFLFSLLLAVGWTNVSAQLLPTTKSFLPQMDFTGTSGISISQGDTKVNAPMRESAEDRPMVSLTEDQAKALKYHWNCNGKDSISNAAQVAYDPEQIYELLKFVYTNPAFPGPYTNAYSTSGYREDTVYYGGVERGWDIPFKAGSGHFEIGGDIIIGLPNGNCTYLSNISVYNDDNNNLLAQWTASNDGNNFSPGWSILNAPLFYNGEMTMTISNGFARVPGSGTISISSSLLGDAENVRVEVTGYSTYSSTETPLNKGWNCVINVDGIPFDLSGYTASNPCTCKNIVNRKQWVDTGAKRPTDVLISTGSSDVYLYSIKITGASGTTYVDWTDLRNGMPTTPTCYINKTARINRYYGIYFDNSYDQYNRVDFCGTLRFPAELFKGESSVTVTVTAYGSGTVSVANKYRPISFGAGTPVTKTIKFPPVEDYQTYRPNQEGYTALIVSVYDESGEKGRLPWHNYPLDRACKFTRKADVIKYIKDNIKFVKLLTDGVRVGDGENIGTVFRCDGTYNKFFFLGKGQARKKDSGVLASIGTGDPLWPDFMCEQLPFHYMYEQFSPTTPADQSQIEDFYTEMMDGQLYDIVHDCPSVIQNEHQFSMSGNNGTTAYGMTGMNFYIPDYRLKYWKRSHELYGGYQIDGRDMNAYLMGGADTTTSRANNQADHIGVYFGMYNPDHAPKVGVYKITLDATVAPVEGYDIDSNAKYNITLDWVSSLDQMSGSHYPQHYNIYQMVVDEDGTERLVKVAEVDHDDENDFNHYNIYSIIVDENGNETRGEKIGQGNLNNPTDDPTFLTLPTDYLQGDYSQTFTFIIEGWPMNSDRRPTFFAWSNPDQVIIPGKSQFISLKLDHYESDFIINGTPDLDYLNEKNENYQYNIVNTGDKIITGEHNYYRNFVTVNSDEVMSGLTIDKINQGMYRFDMLRSTLIPKEEGELKIARLEFDQNILPGAKEVNFTITYDDNTQYLVANKFRRTESNMNIPESGTVRVMGNGDLVIQPNGYHVNFYSITVRRGNSTIATWNNTTNYGTTNNLPSGWYLSPGSLWVQDHDNDPYYLEGGGYIAIPNVINGSEEVTVTINASGDMSTVPTILVDDRMKKIETGDAQDYTWTIPVEGQSISLNYYERITSVDQITDGARYLIVCENKSRAINGGLTNTLNGTSNSADVTISGDHKITTEEGDMYYFTIEKVGNNYAIKSKNGYYIRSNGGANDDMTANTTAAYNTITFSGNNVIIADSNHSNAKLQYSEYSTGWIFQTWYYYFHYFTGNQTPIQLYKYVETGTDNPDYGKLRIGALPFVDQFKAETKYDEHPYRYGYQLKEVVSEGANSSNVVYGKASSMVEVPVQHTNSKVNGYFTLDSIDNDIYIQADTNLMSAEVLTELSGTNSKVFFNTIQARKNQNPVVFNHYATVLQQQTDFSYKEMKDPSARFGNIYYPGTYSYFDSLKVKGKYQDGKRVYIPSIMTRGIDRRYYTSDTLHNTYGAPIYRTGVGKVVLDDATAVLMRHKQTDFVSWHDGTDSCNLFTLDSIQATGYLPSNAVSNVDYEPYMFRLYVKSANGKLRPYSYGANGKLEPASFDPNDATATHGPLCVWSGYVKSIPDQAGVSDYGEMFGKEALGENPQNEKDYKYKYNKYYVGRTKENPDLILDQEKFNGFFGAVKDIVYLKDEQGNIVTNNNKPVMKNQIDPNDLTIYVRFYYIGKGLADGHTPRIAHSNVPEASAPAGAPRRDGEAPANGYTGPSGYPADSQGYAPGIATAVNEILFHGEIVKTTYYNLQGMESSKPFDGLNIVVNRYSDGTTQAFKVMY